MKESVPIYIAKYLSDYSELQIKGLGKFHLSHQPAKIKAQEQLIFPPENHCHFIPGEETKQHDFVDYLIYQTGKSKLSCQRAIRGFVKSIHTHFASSPLPLHVPCLGVFEQIDDELIFDGDSRAMNMLYAELSHCNWTTRDTITELSDDGTIETRQNQVISESDTELLDGLKEALGIGVIENESLQLIDSQEDEELNDVLTEIDRSPAATEKKTDEDDPASIQQNDDLDEIVVPVSEDTEDTQEIEEEAGYAVSEDDNVQPAETGGTQGLEEELIIQDDENVRLPAVANSNLETVESENEETEEVVESSTYLSLEEILARSSYTTVQDNLSVDIKHEDPLGLSAITEVTTEKSGFDAKKMPSARSLKRKYRTKDQQLNVLAWLLGLIVLLLITSAILLIMDVGNGNWKFWETHQLGQTILAPVEYVQIDNPTTHKLLEEKDIDLNESPVENNKIAAIGLEDSNQALLPAPHSCMIVAGAFKDQSNVQDMISRIDDLGYQSHVIEYNGLMCVGLTAPCRSSALRSALNHVRSQIEPGSWVLRISDF